ncbi:Hypothetical protein FKW44_007967, partial [Caligus rogercresseyi]
NVDDHRKSLKTLTCKPCWTKTTLKQAMIESHGEDTRGGKWVHINSTKDSRKTKNIMRNAAHQ